MKFEAILFDMDGVIVDSEVLFDNADTALFKKYGKAYNREEVAALLTGMHLEAGTAQLIEKYGFESDVQSLMLERQSLLRDEYEKHLKYISGFESFFERAVSENYKTAVATSSNDYLLGLVVKKLQLDKKFGKHIYKASDVGNVSKPNPAVYLYAAKQIKTDPSKCLVIEDAPKGVASAKNAGMYCIGITTTLPRELLKQADSVVDSFEEINLQSLA